MPTVAHSAKISSLDLKRGPSAVGFIMRYHSSHTAPGMRPLRGQKSLPYGEELSPIHSSMSRTSSSAMPGLPTAASMVLASIRMSPASGRTANDAFTGDGTSVVRQAGRRPGIKAAMQHLDLGIAEHGEQVIAAAGLAEAGIHRLFVDDGGFLAGKPGAAERVGELGLQFLHAFRGRGRKESEYLVHIDGTRQMSGAVGIRIPGVDDDTRLLLNEVGEFAGRNQNVRHGRPLLFCGCS